MSNVVILAQHNREQVLQRIEKIQKELAVITQVLLDPAIVFVEDEHPNTAMPMDVPRRSYEG